MVNIAIFKRNENLQAKLNISYENMKIKLSNENVYFQDSGP